MKKIFPYILIVLIIVQLLAPFTVGVGIKNNPIVRVNKAEATEEYYYIKTNTLYQTQTPSGKFTGEATDAENLAKCNADRDYVTTGYTNGPCQLVTATDTDIKIDPNNNPSDLPVCSLNPWSKTGSFSGCFAQLFYYVLFVPTSYIFALAGTFFDFTFHYSIQDGSYRTPFVVEGWGIVRDFVNMFFIFVLLYIAFGTILNLHSVKTKEMIINVVIIGLLINFSLFATQVIIDASNILARVFYNSDTIKITQGGANGVANVTPGLKIGPNGEIPLSAAIVNKVNPQNLIINGRKAVKIQDKFTGEESDATQTEGNLGTGAFILITFLATAVNIVGIIAFSTIGLIFVARVIGLWLAMIFAPLAFFSYTIPAMQEWGMVGWKKWWPETLKLAFLAPIFIFFMYLIISFLEKGLSLIKSNETTDGMTFVISIIVPFIFIMILLMKAKDIAKSMSGTMGQSITNGIAAVGGVALGGAALGAAALGRNTIGAFMKGASTGDTAAQRLRAGDPTLTGFGMFKGRLQQISGIDWAQQRVGARLNANQADIGRAAHSRHELDTAAGVVAPGKKWGELNGEERRLARTNLERTVEIRNTPGIQNLTWGQLSAAQQGAITAAIAPRLATSSTTADTTLIPQARRKVGLGENIIQSTVGGSFDVRNLSKLIAGEQDRGINKLATGITSALASSMRGIIKQTNINYGTGQKDFIKDLGNTITEALKSTTIKVDLSHVGEEKKEDAHGGGGH